MSVVLEIYALNKQDERIFGLDYKSVFQIQLVQIDYGHENSIVKQNYS